MRANRQTTDMCSGRHTQSSQYIASPARSEVITFTHTKRRSERLHLCTAWKYYTRLTALCPDALPAAPPTASKHWSTAWKKSVIYLYYISIQKWHGMTWHYNWQQNISYQCGMQADTVANHWYKPADRQCGVICIAWVVAFHTHEFTATKYTKRFHCVQSACSITFAIKGSQSRCLRLLCCSTGIKM